MPAYKNKVCPKCGQEKKSYLFDPSDKGICILCAKRNLFKKNPGRGQRKGDRPRPGSFWRSTGRRRTRRQILEVFFDESGIEKVRFMIMDGPHKGRVAEHNFFGFRRKHVLEKDEDRDFHGWTRDKRTNHWRKQRLEWIEKYGFNPGWDLGEE